MSMGWVTSRRCMSDAAMRRLNYLVDVEHRDAAVVAREFLDSLRRT